MFLSALKTEQCHAQSKNSDYVCGSCGTSLSTPQNSGVDNGVQQLPQTLSESLDYVTRNVEKQSLL